MQTWKDDEFLLGFKFSRVQMYEQFMGDFTLYRDSASRQVQL